ncbi:MAG: ammonium transporter [Deltaproteobacteria bacterium]|nr:ammonium transporter [Deltaproteobacteria bacterium]
MKPSYSSRLSPRTHWIRARLVFRAIAFALPLIVLSSAYAQAQEDAPVLTSKDYIDGFWVLVASGLVFFMQAGFLAFEIGCVRPKNTVVTALKNLGDWVIVSLVFFVVGFGLMFGSSDSGLVGVDHFVGPTVTNSAEAFQNVTFFLFQLAFCGTAATIVSGAMAERTGFKAYLIFTVLMGAVIYPVFGHWVWGGGMLSDNKPWLASMGFVDFAGSSVVHCVGAWASLAGIKVVGPRIGRFSKTGESNKLESNNLAWAVLGVLILWFGWWGFNGGSTLSMNSDVPTIILNTNLAAAAAAVMAFLHAQTLQAKRDVEAKMLGGALGGLVAITACAHVVTPTSAVFIGLIAGVIHNYAFEFISDTLFLDDVVGAIAVHGFCGVWGILSVALFGIADRLPHSMLTQLGVQALGCVVCFVWAYGTSYLVFTVVKHVTGIRVLPMREIRGLTLSHVDDDDDDDDDEEAGVGVDLVAGGSGPV